jgi:thiosulfate/3-mercaptopyruvate sulfurtransferase
MKKIFLFFLLLTACQSQPTKVFESDQVKEKSGPILSEKTIVVDARPPFEYSLAHINGAINLRWEDFAQRELPYRGLLEPDLFFLARRLARNGIAPETPVVIVGRGLQGGGEEGRLAWTFRVLGVKHVRFTSIDTFSIPLTSAPPPPIANAPIWKPEVDEGLRVDRKTFLKHVMKVKHPEDRAIVIDARSEAEYLGKDTRSYYSKAAPDLGAINIPWDQFFDSQMQTNTGIKQKLTAVGITPEKTIYVIDDTGARSAAVTLALRDLGFHKAANYAGGYMELIGSKGGGTKSKYLPPRGE